LPIPRIAYRLKVSERIVRDLLVQAGILRPPDPAEHARQRQIDLKMRRATLRQIAVWNRQRVARRWV
jgi:hypothetical protein